MSANLDLSPVDIKAEFELAKVPFEPAGLDEVRIVCPFHSDTSPSCCVNTDSKLYRCHVASCNARGTFVNLFAALTKRSASEVITDLEAKYNIRQVKSIDIDVVESYHVRIWSALDLLAELYKRGVTDADIRLYRLGEHAGRVTIPIFDRAGRVVNLRSYQPGGPTKTKMRDAKGFGASRAFPIEQIDYGKILLAGGECKAIVAARQLNPHGVGAIYFTKGESALTADNLELLRGKEVYICMDVDAAGVSASSQIVVQTIPVCSVVKQIHLPLDRAKHPKGDINDFISEGGELYPLILASKVLTLADMASGSVDRLIESEPVAKRLVEVFHADNVGERIVTNGVVSVMDDAPYVVPKTYKVKCQHNSPVCSYCPVILRNTDQLEIPAESPELLKFVGSKVSPAMERASVGIPALCRVSTLTATDYYNLQDLRVGPPMGLAEWGGDSKNMPVFCIGDSVELASGYALTGRTWPHPKTSQAVFLASGSIPLEDNLKGFTVEDPEALKVFQQGDKSIQGKLDHIYEDLAANVTRIFKRDALHLTCDLAFHSVLYMPFDGQDIKGWVEALIVGDSSLGKSFVSERLSDHYRLGAKIDCKNASVAGLLGGCEQSGDRWFISWGAIPSNDRRLVILQELKGAAIEVIGKLTEMRSSGIAQIQKIQRRVKHARTRLIAVSNPRSEIEMARFNCGVEAVRELIGAPEDVRRFDIASIVTNADITAEELHRLQSSRPVVEAVYTSDLCNQLVLWAWTREANQIHFTPEAYKEILEQASRLCEAYHESIPLVDRGSMRQKLARLSAALAARLYSTPDYVNLFIQREHVQYIAEFLDKTYSAPQFGYKRYSEAMLSRACIRDPEDIRLAVMGVPFASEFTTGILERHAVDANDIMDLAGVDFTEAKQLIGLLVRKGALHRNGRYNSYLKSPPFIDLLREINRKIEALPAHITGSTSTPIPSSSVATIPQHLKDSM